MQIIVSAIKKKTEGCVENGLCREMTENEECLVNIFVPTLKGTQNLPRARVSMNVCWLTNDAAQSKYYLAISLIFGQMVSLWQVGSQNGSP